jgi:hypothetical protein
MVKKDKRLSRGMAIAALALNILTIPGIGTIVGGKLKRGILQISIAIISLLTWIVCLITLVTLPIAERNNVPILLTILTLISCAVMISNWIWGVFIGIKLIKNSNK